jgi:hypothetical protein
LLQTTGREDANAPYTRGTAIVLPQGTAGQPAEKLQRLFAHELFHILSRRDKAFREQMYATIGFHLCEEIPLPVELRPRKITNPDAPRIDCYLRIATDDGEFSVAPVLYAQVDKFDPQAGRTLFQLLEFRLLKLTREGERWMPALRDGQPELLDPRSVASFHQQIGQNTGYIIHPDEVLADNFVHLVFGTPDDKLKTPALITRMKTALANWSTSSAASDSHQ